MPKAVDAGVPSPHCTKSGEGFTLYLCPQKLHRDAIPTMRNPNLIVCFEQFSQFSVCWENFNGRLKHFFIFAPFPE